MKQINFKKAKTDSTVASSPENHLPQIEENFGYKPLITINGAAARTKGQHMDHPKETYYWIYPKP